MQAIGVRLFGLFGPVFIVCNFMYNKIVETFVKRKIDVTICQDTGVDYQGQSCPQKREH